MHALAEPTKLEAMKKEFEQQKSSAKEEHKSKLLEKYGGEVSIISIILTVNFQCFYGHKITYNLDLLFVLRLISSGPLRILFPLAALI